MLRTKYCYDGSREFNVCHPTISNLMDNNLALNIVSLWASIGFSFAWYIIFTWLFTTITHLGPKNDCARQAEELESASLGTGYDCVRVTCNQRKISSPSASVGQEDKYRSGRVRILTWRLSFLGMVPTKARTSDKNPFLANLRSIEAYNPCDVFAMRKSSGSCHGPKAAQPRLPLHGRR